jgi:hypothetical protein
VHNIYFEERAVTVHTTNASVHNFHDGILVEWPHNGSPEEPIRIHRNEGWWIRCVWKYCCLLGSIYDCRHRQCFAPNDERAPILSVEYVHSASHRWCTRAQPLISGVAPQHQRWQAYSNALKPPVSTTADIEGQA